MNCSPPYPAHPLGIALLGAVALGLPFLLSGCGKRSEEPELVYGKPGVQEGNFRRPRAVAIGKTPNDEDCIFIVDFTARIQVFDRNGKYLERCWTTPRYDRGRPSGLSIDRDGNLLVSDSHYNCLRTYSPEGEEVKPIIGGEGGTKPGQFGYISGAVQDADGYYYVAEFGEVSRISKLDAAGRFVTSWGSAGTEPGQFSRIRALTLGPDGHLYVADACNHRIQVFTRDGKLVRCWGVPGRELGQLNYPYDLAFARKDGKLKSELYVVEYGNHRVQKFTPDGTFLGSWGGRGGAPGQLASPWALAVDSKGRVHVIDTENHRVQRIDF